MMRTLTVLALLACAAGNASAAAIFRCGPRVYSDAPCDGGRLVEAADGRSAAQRAEARRFEAKEKKAAAALARERQASAPLAAPSKVKSK